MPASQQEVGVYQAVRHGGWMTATQVVLDTGINGRTVRRHLLRLVRLGMAEVSLAWPAHRYRLTTPIPRLEEAATVLNSERHRESEPESVLDSWQRR